VRENVRLIFSSIIVAVLMGLAFFTIACTGHASHPKGVYVLVETPAADTDRWEIMQSALNRLLKNLNSEDILAVASIDSTGFGRKHTPKTVRFDQRPSVMTAQKREFQNYFDTLDASEKPGSQPDMIGGLLQAVQFLNQTQRTQKIVLIVFPLNTVVPLDDLNEQFLRLEGIQVMVTDFTRQAEAMEDPEQYQQRMDHWQGLIESGGGSWQVISDLEHLDQIFKIKGNLDKQRPRFKVPSR
jgi:hypothetical protein